MRGKSSLKEITPKRQPPVGHYGSRAARRYRADMVKGLAEYLARQSGYCCMPEKNIPSKAVPPTHLLSSPQVKLVYFAMIEQIRTAFDCSIQVKRHETARAWHLLRGEYLTWCCEFCDLDKPVVVNAIKRIGQHFDACGWIRDDIGA